MQIRLSLHAHAINSHFTTGADAIRQLRWGIDRQHPSPPPPHRHPRLLASLLAAAGLQLPPPMSAQPPTGLRERERRKVGKGGEKRREIVSGLGGRQGRVWRSEGRVCKLCCGCSGKADPSADVPNARMCAGKIIARVFDRVMTYHQKITARVRREISARSARV